MNVIEKLFGRPLATEEEKAERLTFIGDRFFRFLS